MLSILPYLFFRIFSVSFIRYEFESRFLNAYCVKWGPYFLFATLLSAYFTLVTLIEMGSKMLHAKIISV